MTVAHFLAPPTTVFLALVGLALTFFSWSAFPSSEYSSSSYGLVPGAGAAVPAPYGTVFFSFLITGWSVFFVAKSYFYVAYFLIVGLAPSTGYLVVISTLSFLLAGVGVVVVVAKEILSLLLGDSGRFCSISLYLAFYSAFCFCLVS